MKKKSNLSLFKRLTSFAICAAVVFTAVGSMKIESHATSLSALKSQYNSYQSKIEESEAKVKELEAQQAEQESIISELNGQIEQLNRELENIIAQQAIISDDINSSEKAIESLNTQIADLDNQIAQKDKEIDDTVELFCQRMKANYVSGGTSLLELFTSSSSVSGFLNRLEIFKRVTDSDQALVDQLDKEIASIESMQEDLKTKKTELQTQKTKLETKNSELKEAGDELISRQQDIVTKSNEVNAKLESLNYQTQKLNVSIDRYESEMDALDDQIKAFIQNNTNNSSSVGSSSSGGSSSSSGGSSSSTVSSKGWAWPVPYSSSYISSPYGYRNDPISGKYKFHSGIDITMGGAYGKKIVASKAGTVIRTVHSNSGYGNYVMIDHGGGYVTLYGHCSSLAVSTGQKVSQGQTIAYIGTSGYSTGPHVHFEIRLNGEKVNPSNYVHK
ncbi:MAG: peptidoglycan DD-metalloendopeptidase family protein [Clostridia bacterium]|nr:peptidoglycan DD-metalloendopeptidase family protein [Clostridia bacterium]